MKADIPVASAGDADPTSEPYAELRPALASTPATRSAAVSAVAVVAGKRSRREIEAIERLESDIARLEAEVADLGHQINEASAAGDLKAIEARGRSTCQG